MEALAGLAASPVSDALTLLTTRQESLALLRLDGLVDLIIPREAMSWSASFRTTPEFPCSAMPMAFVISLSTRQRMWQRLCVWPWTADSVSAAYRALNLLLLGPVPQIFNSCTAGVADTGVRLRGDTASVALGVGKSAGDDDRSTGVSI